MVFKYLLGAEMGDELLKSLGNSQLIQEGENIHFLAVAKVTTS